MHPERKNTINDFDWRCSLKPILVQAYDVIGGLSRAGEGGTPGSVRVEVHGQATVVDACSVGDMMECSTQLFLWSSLEPSPHGGYILDQPLLAIERDFASVLEKPVFLSLLDLHSKGWRSRLELEDKHVPGGPLLMSNHRVSQRPHYYECLRQMTALFDKGLPDLAPRECDQYYQFGLAKNR